MSFSGDYTVAVCGNIGSGKSTLVAGLCASLGAFAVLEYLDRDPRGPEALERWVRGLDTDDDFQAYIVGSYREGAEQAEASGAARRVFDRTPIEGQLVFSETHAQLADAEDVHARFGIPRPGPGAETAVIDVDRNTAGSVLLLAQLTANEDLRAGRPRRVFYLRSSPSACLARVAARGRSSEAGYSLAYLERIGAAYERLFGLCG